MNGNDCFKTLFGGIVSIFIWIIVVLYSISLFVTLINRQESNNSINKNFINLEFDDTHYRPYEDGFMFGIAFHDTLRNPLEIDQSMINLDFTRISQYRDENEEMTRNYTSFEAVKCADQFPISESFKKEGRVFYHLYCPSDPNFDLRGNLANNDFVRYSVSLSK